MTVITRYRTEEFYLVQLAPGSASAHAMSHGTGYGIVHYVQTGVSVNDDIVR